MIEMNLTDIAVAGAGWVVAGAELVYARWKSMKPQKKGELIEQFSDALEDGTISPEEALSLIESFFEKGSEEHE